MPGPRQGKSRHPRKRFYRARAHSNPLSDSQFPVPISPAHVDWYEHFPSYFSRKAPTEEVDDPAVLATVSERSIETEHCGALNSSHADAAPSDQPPQGASHANASVSDSLISVTVEKDGPEHGAILDTIETPEIPEHDGQVRGLQPNTREAIEPPTSTHGVAADGGSAGEPVHSECPDPQVPESSGNDCRLCRISNAGISALDDARVCTSDPGFDRKVRFADIGCGFGGLLVRLSTMFPNILMVGMELRDKVSEYVKERILALRRENPNQYHNISIIRTNAMKYLQNYFEKGQLQKMFFLFPDPHFKERNHRRRVISVALLAEYAHVLAVGGILYTITDVRELGEWMKSCLDAHPLFEEVSLEEQEADPVVKLLTNATEEGQKVERNNGETFRSVYRRVALLNHGA